MLELRNISASYRRDHLILEGINLWIPQGGRVAVLGRNGAGKSTLLRSLLGLMPYRTGDVLLHGNRINQVPLHKLVSLGIGYFHQGGQVFPQMTVDENLRFAGFKGSGLQGAELDLLYAHFPFLKMARIRSRKAGDLSGGERTQLALAMVFVNNPSLLILDEPFAGISPGNAESIIRFMQENHQKQHYTLLLIEQNQYLAQRLCNAIYVLKQKKLYPFLLK